MDLDHVYNDKYGHSLLRFNQVWRDNERRRGEFLAAKVEIARAIGAREITAFERIKRYNATR